MAEKGGGDVKMQKGGGESILSRGNVYWALKWKDCGGCTAQKIPNGVTGRKARGMVA